MLIQSLTKSQKKRIRELAGTAYERELSRELTALESEFARWRRGEIGPHDLNDHIHRYHQGPNRNLFNTYTSGMEDVLVAGAINHGVLQKDEVDPEILEILSRFLEPADETRKNGD